MLKRAFFFILFVAFSACNSSVVEDVIDTIDVERRPINTARVGVNAFVNDGRFGSIRSQLLEVRDTLRLSFIRVLFDWNDDIQSSPSAEPDFSFYDAIIAGVPSGIDVLVIITGVPSWMDNSSNWVNNNPRLTFSEKWVRSVVARYAGNGSIMGFQIWNEPNQNSNPENSTLNLTNSPENYVELLASAYGIVKDLAPSKRVVSAATTAINQNYPESLDYNRGMRDAGATSFADVWAIHYYGKQYENVTRPGGVADFLNGLPQPIWVTESGAQGVDSQLEYAERTWPFILDEIPGIQRIYQYQFTEASPPESTYGLRNLSADLPVSDLYVFLRDR